MGKPGILIQIGGMRDRKHWREGETFGTNRGRGEDSFNHCLFPPSGRLQDLSDKAFSSRYRWSSGWVGRRKRRSHLSLFASSLGDFSTAFLVTTPILHFDF